MATTSSRRTGAQRSTKTASEPSPKPTESTSGAGDAGKAPQGLLQRMIAGRLAAASRITIPDERFMRYVQKPVWNFLCDHYFRLEIEGWDRIPDEPSLLIGVHSGGSLTMDAWTLIHSWYRRFEGRRILHGTAHDLLMATPGLGDYFRAVGVIPASRAGVTAALAAGHDVVVFPGGEQDSMRNWRLRDKAVLAGRKGFVRQAIRSGVPIVPVATVGGHDTVFVLSEGRFLARWTGLGKQLRGATFPIITGFPLPLAVEILPAHLPLPAKIRTEFLDPIRVDSDPARADDADYVDSVYAQVENAIQSGMDRLAKRRSFPVLG